MKPDTASRLLYQEAALRSFLRSDSIAQSFIQNTPNYNMEDLQQLYFASASIKSKKMLIEFVKISTKQLCLSLRDKLPFFKYLNPDNISTDLTDDELMLLIHEASHSMTLDKQINSHGNIAFLVAKNIIFNLVGVNATATLNSFLKTPDLGSFTSKKQAFDTNSPAFGSTDPFSKSSQAFPMPPSSVSPSSPFPMYQTATSLPLTPASSPPPSAFMPSYGSSPTIISTSIANLSFVSMNSSMPQDSNSFMTVTTSVPPTTTYSVTKSNSTPAIAETSHNTPEPDAKPDFDTRSNASGSSETRFEVIGDSGDSDDDNSRNNFDSIPSAGHPGNRVDATYGNDDSMSIESNESERSENEVEKPKDDDDDDEPKRLDDENNDVDDEDNDVDDEDNHVDNNYQMLNNDETTYDDLYEQDRRTFEQEMLQDDEIKRVFSIPEVDDKLNNVPVIDEMNDSYSNAPPSTPPPIPFLNEPESPRKFPLRKRPRKRKASRYVDDDEEVVNKKAEVVNKNEEVHNRPWLEPDIDFKADELKKNSSIDVTDTITNINQVIEKHPREKKLFADDNIYDLMNDLKHKGVLNIPSSPRNITFSNIDT